MTSELWECQRVLEAALDEFRAVLRKEIRDEEWRPQYKEKLRELETKTTEYQQAIDRWKEHR